MDGRNTMALPILVKAPPMTSRCSTAAAVEARTLGRSYVRALRQPFSARRLVALEYATERLLLCSRIVRTHCDADDDVSSTASGRGGRTGIQ